jgi:hypothetical protein
MHLGYFIYLYLTSWYIDKQYLFLFRSPQILYIAEVPYTYIAVLFSSRGKTYDSIVISESNPTVHGEQKKNTHFQTTIKMLPELVEGQYT